ncbi:hypothetical protein BH10PSE13_BH10PSE13_15080 [soil metagenome]
MRIARRLADYMTLPLALGLMTPAMAANDVLQCVPYARELSGIHIRGDAWTWWEQARGRYARGNEPKPGAVIALANTDVMPLGHVAVVSRIVDDRHILLRHANWSGPGLIENDVMAVDSSPQNDWSQVRIWWGQGRQIGARNNPVNGFIYPEKARQQALLDERAMGEEEAAGIRPAVYIQAAPKTMHAPRLEIDPSLFRKTKDTYVSSSWQAPARSLAMIVRDVRREARLP